MPSKTVKPKATVKPISAFRPAQVNPNKGSERGVRIIEDSISNNGAGRSMLADVNGEMIAGSHTLEALADLGFTHVIEVETDGTIPVVVKRVDTTIDSPKGRALQISDNQGTVEGYVADNALILQMLQQNEANGIPYEASGFTLKDLKVLNDIVSNAPIQVSTPSTQSEPQNAFAHLIEMRCSPDALSAIYETLQEWKTLYGIEINIS